MVLSKSIEGFEENTGKIYLKIAKNKKEDIRIYKYNICSEI